jgi:peptide/nickel transport system permease protein
LSDAGDVHGVVGVGGQASYAGVGWAVLRADRKLLGGAIIVLTSLVLAVLGPVIAPFDPLASGVGPPLAHPSLRHWMGTDRVGMDVFSRLISAARIDVFISLAAATLAMAVGTTLGLITGYRRSFVTELLIRVSDLVKSFPVFVLAMLAVVATGRNVGNLVFVLAFLNAPVFHRLIHAQTLYLRSSAFIEAAQVVGNPESRILYRHILPNSLGLVFAEFSVVMGSGMLLISSLSFVGAGVKVPTPEWGSMIAIGAVSIMEGGYWWPSVFPGLALTTTVVGYSLVGNALHQMTDPKRR